MSRPRLWVVSELYWPEDTSTGYFLTRIAEGLADRFEVGVICSPPTYSERHLKVPRAELRHGTRIRRTRSTRLDKDRALGRIVNLATFTLGALWLALRLIRRGDRVLVVTNPPTLPPAIGFIARLKRARATLLVHDVYPEVLVATGHVRAGGPAERAVGAFMRWTARLFGDVVVLGRDMRELYARKLPPGARIHIIPNWGDTDEVVPLPRAQNAFAAAHGLGDRTVIQVSGNLGRTHDIELVLDVARRLRDRADIVFVIAGYGGKAKLAQAEGARAPGNVVVLPRQPRDQLGAMLAAADATIIAFVDRMYGVSVPSRMYNVMAAGVPIIAIADPRSELALVIEEADAGWVIANDADVLTALVTAIADRRAGAAEKGAAARAEALARYRLPHVVDAFARVLA